MNAHRCRRAGTLPALVVLLAAAAHLLAQEAPPDTLDVAAVLRLAANQSRTAVITAADSARAAAAVDRAGASWWPSVNAQGTYTIRDNPVEAGAGEFTFPVQPKNQLAYELSAREVLWNGGRRGQSVTAAEREQAAVQAAGAASRQQTQLDALDAYLGVLELTGGQHVVEQRLAALNAHLKVVSDLFDQGLTARNDLLETQVQVRKVEDSLARVAHAWATARADLNRRLGRDPAAAAVLPDSLPPPPPLPAGREQLADSATSANARLHAARARLAASRAQVELARRAWYPTLFVGLAHTYTESDYLVHPHVNSVQAGVSWDVFDGGARKADVHAAEAGVTAAERDRLEATRAVAVEVDRAWRAWDQAGRELATARANVAASRENLRIVSDQYRAGVARSSDVLEAEALLARSRYDVVTRHYATYRAQAALLVAAGRDLIAFYADEGTAPEGR